MFFQTAGIEVAPWVPPLVAFVISFFTSMGGISGALLLLPFQVTFLGYANPSVSATNHLFNIAAIPGGVHRYYKEGRMVWPLTWAVIIGTLPGVFIGAIVRVNYLPDPKIFELFAALVLFYIGGKMIWDLIRNDGDACKESTEQRFEELIRLRPKHDKNSESTGAYPLPGIRVTRFDLKRVGYNFCGEHFEASTRGVFALSFVVGVVGGIYGFGGGAIIAPFFVSILKLPVHTIAGAALMGTFITSVAGVIFYQAIGPYYPNLSVAPDWPLGVLFGLGGMAGIYLGARCQKYVPANIIEWVLVGTVVFTAGQYVLFLFWR